MGNFSNSCFSNKEAVVGIIWLQFSPTLQSLSDKTFFLLFPIKPNCDIEILEVQATNQWIKTTFFPFVFENSFPNQSPFFYIFVFYLYIHISVSVNILYIVLVFSLLSDRNNWFQFFARPMISWSPHWWERKGSIVSEQSLHHRTFTKHGPVSIEGTSNNIWFINLNFSYLFLIFCQLLATTFSRTSLIPAPWVWQRRGSLKIG